MGGKQCDRLWRRRQVEFLDRDDVERIEDIDVAALVGHDDAALGEENEIPVGYGKFFPIGSAQGKGGEPIRNPLADILHVHDFSIGRGVIVSRQESFGRERIPMK